MPYKDRETQLQAQRNHYTANKQDYMNRDKKRRIDRHKWFVELMSTKSCLLCPEDSSECLDWHHLDPEIKIDRIPKMLKEFQPMKRILNEMEKCVVLCANCHRKVHAGTLTLPEMETSTGVEPAFSTPLRLTR